LKQNPSRPGDTPQPTPDRSFKAKVFKAALRSLENGLDPQELNTFTGFYEALATSDSVPVSHQVIAFKILGERAASADRSDLAVELFDVAARLDPSDPTIPYNMGNHLDKIGRPDDAIAAYRSALAIDPRFSYALYNRGRLLFDSGRIEDGMSDFLRAAQEDIDLDGFASSVGERVIRERGFAQFRQWFLEASMPRRQSLSFLSVLAEAPAQAAGWGAWYLQSVIKSDASEAFATIYWRADLADIVRESPLDVFVAPGLHMSRGPDGYHAKQLNETDILSYLWYRPARWGLADPKVDRATHLQRLAEVIDAAEGTAALEVLWAARYMSGAIALSTLLSGRRDWPSPVARLSVPSEFRPPSGFYNLPGAGDSVISWLAARAAGGLEEASLPLTCADFAMKEFRAAAEVLLTLRTDRDAPLAPVVLVGDDGQPIMVEGEWARGSLAPELAAEIWSEAEPVFREWVTSSVLAPDPAEHIEAASRARQFNSLTATELWSKLPAQQWHDCRTKILDAYRSRLDLDDLRAELGNRGVLLDFYVHEVVEDTIVRLTIGPDETKAVELTVDVMAGELQALLGAHHPGEMPPEGLAGGVDSLLLETIRDDLDAAETLVIVPFGYLRNLPFHALTTLCRVIDRGTLTSIAYLPSSSFLPRFRGAANSKPGRCLFVGADPSGDIDIDGELDIMRELLPDITVLRDEDAVVEDVIASLGEYDTVHFACHGEVDPEIRAGYVELANGRLYPWDVLSAERVPKTVVLNACLTSSTEIFEETSDEAFGLHSAFMAAGTTRVVGGLWDVNEWSAKNFTSAFYEGWTAGNPVATAVLRAQQALRVQTPDPFLWAPHAFFGDWR
jgi:tetratricopeptide (TPR) repeat protein